MSAAGFAKTGARGLGASAAAASPPTLPVAALLALLAIAAAAAPAAPGAPAAPAAPAAPPAVALRFVSAETGAFAVDVGGAPWFSGAPPVLLANGSLYAAARGGLALTSNATRDGEDVLGAFSVTTLSWRTVGGAAPGLLFETAFFVYASGALLQFEAVLPPGLAAQPPGGASNATGGLASTFPSLALTPLARAMLQLGSVFQPPKSGNCGWTVNALPACTYFSRQTPPSTPLPTLAPNPPSTAARTP